MTTEKRAPRRRKQPVKRDQKPHQRAQQPAAPVPTTVDGVERDFASVMRDLIAERWGIVWAAVPVALAGDDSEGVHDVRVASRRLRAAMDVAVECFPAKWYRPLHKTAKEITSALGEVRDRDVLLEALRRQRDAAAEAEQPGIDRLIVRVEQERTAARSSMEAYLERLLESGTIEEATRRFGPAAAPPERLKNGKEGS